MKAKSLKAVFTVLISLALLSADAQEEREEKIEEKGFKKENLFTGGSISLGFSSNSFQVGASPFFGYSIAPWIDAGVTVNYNYVSYRDVYVNSNDKLRRSTYGGGAFTRIYPVNFIFLQGQFEHNFITEKFIPGGGGASEKNKVEANSLLLGAGYASGRYPGSGQPFFYLSILFDVLDNEYSPYTRSGGGIIPIIRGGLQVPLFQGR
jgi:hypothetical protein